MLLFNKPGVDPQSAAVLAYLRGREGVESSYDFDRIVYVAEPEVYEWHNGRENGYVVSLRGPGYSRQLNVAFFEHRNSDVLCALVFEATTMNPPTLDDLPAAHPYHGNKYAVDHQVSYGHAADMADWIMDQLELFWTTVKSKAD
jgi:hypothetical protein